MARGRKPKDPEATETNTVYIPIELGKKKNIITADSRQWILNEIRKDKEGNEVLSPVKFYATLPRLINSMAEAKLRKSELDSWQSVANRMEEIKKELYSFFTLKQPTGEENE